MKSNKQNYSAAILFLIFTLLPISLYSANLLDTSFIIILSILGFFALWRLKLKGEIFVYLFMCIIYWSAVYLFTSIYSSRFDIRKLGSFAFFIAPYFSYYLGRLLNSKLSFLNKEYLFKTFAVVMSLFSIAVLMNIIVLKSSVRISAFNVVDGVQIAGDKIGFNSPLFNLYGAWGIHSYIDFLVIVNVILLFTTINRKTHIMIRTITLIGLAANIYMILFSFSREAWLALVVVGALWITRTLQLKPIRSILLLTAVSISGIYFFNSISNTFIIERQAQFIANGNLNDLSSGRLGIVANGLSFIAEYPLSGSIISTPEFSYSPNSSLHNQWLTNFYKLGLIGGGLLIVHIISIFRGALRDKNTITNPYRELLLYILTAILVLSLFWDVLLVNHIGTLVFFIVGLTTPRGYTQKLRSIRVSPSTVLFGGKYERNV